MLNFRYLLFIFVLISVSACNNGNLNTPNTHKFQFEDGFETQNNTIDELFPLDGSRWSNVQRNNPSGKMNEVSISNAVVSKGQNSLRVFAYKSNNLLSKMDIEKDGFKAYAGEKVIIKADFYINSNANIKDLFLLDLESCSCWDPTVNANSSPDGDNKCPGIRLKMSGNNDYLSIERGKISGSTLEQTTFQFPRKEWVHVQWELTLSDEEDGYNKLIINGIEVIANYGMNLPNAQIFHEIFAQEGIDFTLQEPVFYERIQIGATAHPTSEDIELFVDNVSICIE